MKCLSTFEFVRRFLRTIASSATTLSKLLAIFMNFFNSLQHSLFAFKNTD